MRHMLDARLPAAARRLRVLAPLAAVLALIAALLAPVVASAGTEATCPDGSPRDTYGNCTPTSPPPSSCPDGSPRDEYGKCTPTSPPPNPCLDGSARDEQGNCASAPPPCTVGCAPVETSGCTANCAPATPTAPAPPVGAPAGTPVRTPAASVGGRRAGSATARLRTPSRCASTTFRVTVSGRGMRRVTFWVAGRRVRTVAVAAGRRSITVSLPIRRFGARRQPVQARVSFRNGARARTLTAPATRCAQGAVSPQFTG